MAPAMDEAYQALRGAAAKLKHVIILTDGISAPGDFQGITADMASSQITVSTVGIGQGAHEELLKQIAEWGSGRFYFTDDPGAIPQIFTKETMTASKSAISELPFLPQTVRPSAAMGGIDLESAPFLLGYVITRPKPTSEVILASESGDPLLSWWRYGLGMSVAFTSDAKSRWGAEWLSWSGFGKFWAQVVRHAMRRSEAKGFHVQIEPSPGRAVVTIDAADPTGAFLNEAESALKVIDPGLTTREVGLEQIAPGRYRGEFATPDEGSYHLELTQQSQGQVLYRQSRGLAVNYPEELRLRPTNETLLRGIATATGGAYDPAPEVIFAETAKTAPRAEALWPWLLWAAVWLFVVDVALRRIDLSLLLSRLRRPRAA
jgi:Ca-activated chloride channel family protein